MISSSASASGSSPAEHLGADLVELAVAALLRALAAEHRATVEEPRRRLAAARARSRGRRARRLAVASGRSVTRRLVAVDGRSTSPSRRRRWSRRASARTARSARGSAAGSRRSRSGRSAPRAASSSACQRRLSSGSTSRKPLTARMAAGFVMSGEGGKSALLPKASGPFNALRFDPRAPLASTIEPWSETPCPEPRRRSRPEPDCAVPRPRPRRDGDPAGRVVGDDASSTSSSCSRRSSRATAKRPARSARSALDYLEAFHLPASQHVREAEAGRRHGAVRHRRCSSTASSGAWSAPEYYAGARAERLRAPLRRTRRARRWRRCSASWPDASRSSCGCWRRSARTSCSGASRTRVRIYKRWLRTGGAREADMLMRRGLIPFAPPTSQKQ